MSDAHENTEINSGGHTFRFESPDVFFLGFDGDVTGDDMEAIGELFRRLAPAKFVVLVNAEKMGEWTGEAKNRIRGTPISSGIAVVGADAKTKVVLSILNRVYMMVYMGADNPIHFAKSEADARAWVNRRRAEIASKA